MTRTSLQDVTCSIARTVDILSDAWAWLIVRDVFLGVRRFDDLCADLGISRKVLAERLKQLTAAGVVDRAEDADGPARFDYRLTDKGAELVPILSTLVAWGDRWEPTPGGPPVYLRHHRCGATGVAVTCVGCGDPVTAETVVPQAGPGGSSGPGTAIIGSRLHAAPARDSTRTDSP